MLKFILVAMVLIGSCIGLQTCTMQPQKPLSLEQEKFSKEKLEDGDLVLVGSTEKQLVYCFKRGPGENTWFAKRPAGPFGGGSGVDWAYAQRIVRPKDVDYCKFTCQFMKQ